MNPELVKQADERFGKHRSIMLLNMEEFDWRELVARINALTTKLHELGELHTLDFYQEKSMQGKQDPRDIACEVREEETDECNTPQFMMMHRDDPELVAIRKQVEAVRKDMYNTPASAFVAFLYQIMRDHVPTGVIERIVSEQEASLANPKVHGWELSNQHIKAYAREIEQRLHYQQEAATTRRTKAHAATLAALNTGESDDTE